MKTKLLFAFGLLLLLCPAVVRADTFYRETFNYCAAPSGRPAAANVAGWHAITANHAEGKPSILKIQIVGAGTLLPAVASDPEGPQDGNAYWDRTTVTKGLLLYTEEKNFDVARLLKASWRQRVDRQDKEFANYGARLALLIGDQWYISDYSATQRNRGNFERRVLQPSLLTYGTTPQRSGIGIVAPTNSGLRLPAQGTVRAFGLFFIRSFAKVRIDDFSLVDSAAEGTNLPDRQYERCGDVVTDPNSGPDDANSDVGNTDAGGSGNNNGTTGGGVTPTPTPTPAPTPAPAPKAACEDGLDNDGDGLVDLADPGCKNAKDNIEAGGIPPNAPAGLQASDGTSADFVQATWSPVAEARTYRLYRSQFSPVVGDLIADSVTTTSFTDTSAVPGVTYYYSVTALNEFEDESTPSNIDPGFRSSPLSDSDGDGVLDAQEALDGTDAHDPGSFQLHLKSPTYSKYNTYLRQRNFLELGASGTKTIVATVTLFNIDGQVITNQTVSIPAKTELDLDINDLLVRGCAENESACTRLRDIDGNGVADTYGSIRIDFNDFTTDPGATLTGRMSNYRLDADAVHYSFAFAKELRNPTQGITFATANTYDPQNRGFMVPNWLEVSNFDSQSRDFDYFLWDQEGALVKRRTISVPTMGEIDVEAGHDIVDEHGKLKEAEYLVEVRPREGATNYYASVSRYSSNSLPGIEPDTYNFAFALDARAGTGSTQYAPISNLQGESGRCYSQSNWLEVANTREIPVSAVVSFRDTAGQTLATSGVLLNPKSQYHFNASALLATGMAGSAEIASSDPAALIAQSLVYYHHCRENSLETAYSVQGRIPSQDLQQGSVNTYLQMENEIFILSTLPAPATVTATLRTFELNFSDQTTTVATEPYSRHDLTLTETSALAISPEHYGALTLQQEHPHSFVAGVLRHRYNSDGTVNFVMPTLVQ